LQNAISKISVCFCVDLTKSKLYKNQVFGRTFANILTVKYSPVLTGKVFFLKLKGKVWKCIQVE